MGVFYPWGCKMPLDKKNKAFFFHSTNLRVDLKVISEVGAFVDMGTKSPGLYRPLCFVRKPRSLTAASVPGGDRLLSAAGSALWP